MSNNEKFKGVKGILMLADLPNEIVGRDIVFEGHALEPSAVSVRMNLGKVGSVDGRCGEVIGGRCYYYLILMTDCGMKYTYCGFGDYWHFEQDGKIYVGKIKIQDGEEK